MTGSAYVVNAQGTRKFSIIWPSFLAFFVLLSIPHLIRSIRNGRAYNTIPGILERLNDGNDSSTADSGVSSSESPVSKKNHRLVTSLQNLCGAIGSVFFWTLPGFNLNAGQRSSFLSPRPTPSWSFVSIFSTRARILCHHTRSLHRIRYHTHKQL